MTAPLGRRQALAVARLPRKMAPTATPPTTVPARNRVIAAWARAATIRPSATRTGLGRPRAVGPLGRLRAQRAGCYRARTPDRVPGRGDRGGCGAGRADARDELARGSLEEAERYLALAARGLESMPADRRGRSQVVLGVVRMRFARQRGDVPAVAEEAQRLLAPAEAADPAGLGLGGDLRALALIDLGIAELWTARFAEADQHLEDGIALARQLGRPYLEVTALAHWAQLASWRSFPRGGAAEQAGDRTGRTARLDRGAGCW
jgi:hypothetical protein